MLGRQCTSPDEAISPACRGRRDRTNDVGSWSHMLPIERRESFPGCYGPLSNFCVGELPHAVVCSEQIWIYVCSYLYKMEKPMFKH